MGYLSIMGIARKYNLNRKIVVKTMADNPDFPANIPPEYRAGDREGFRCDEKKVEEWLLTHSWSYGDPKYKPHMAERIEREAEEQRQKQIAAGINPNAASKLVQTVLNERAGKNNKSEVQTALLQLELDKKRGNLVQRDDVINHFAPRIAMLAKSLEMIPNSIGKRHGLSDEAIRDLRDDFDRIRETLCLSMKEGVMADDFVTSDDDAE